MTSGQAVLHLEPATLLPAPNGDGTDRFTDDARLRCVSPVAALNHEQAIMPLEPIFRVPALDPGPDLRTGETQGDSVGASKKRVQPKQKGPVLDGAPEKFVDLPTLHALLGHYARQYQDVQQVRIAMGNRAAAMERDGLPEAWRLSIESSADDLKRLETAIGRQLERLSRQHFMRDWIEQAPGISLAGFARLLGITGPLDNFATVSKLWAYLGLAVVDGHAPKRQKGEKLNFSPRGRTLCYLIAEAIVKVNRGPYRAAYDRKKAEYEADRPDWTQAHRHNAAMRYAVKTLLRDLWAEWHRRQKAVIA